jgi:Zn-dependent peptidase ImmA (M78 family)
MDEMIFNQAQRCRERYRTSDPYELLDAMGVALVNSDAYPRNGLRGYCTVMNRTGYVVINQKQPEEEQRVVAAHEGGHLILHAAQLKVGAMRDFDVYNVTSRLELQANSFAADFLIDDEEVLDLMHSHDADFFNVAKELLVPAPFLSFKLYSMVNRGFNMHVPVDLNSTFLK